MDGKNWEIIGTKYSRMEQVKLVEDFLFIFKIVFHKFYLVHFSIFCPTCCIPKNRFYELGNMLRPWSGKNIQDQRSAISFRVSSSSENVIMKISELNSDPLSSTDSVVSLLAWYYVFSLVSLLWNLDAIDPIAVKPLHFIFECSHLWNPILGFNFLNDTIDPSSFHTCECSIIFSIFNYFFLDFHTISSDISKDKGAAGSINFWLVSLGCSPSKHLFRK